MESTSLPFDQVVEGNCIDVLAGFPAESVDILDKNRTLGCKMTNVPICWWRDY
jgi:hypothetical protein